MKALGAFFGFWLLFLGWANFERAVDRPNAPHEASAPVSDGSGAPPCCV